MSALYPLIPLFPLIASVTIALTGRRLGERSRYVGVTAVGLSFGLSIMAFVELVLRGEPRTISLYELFRSGSLVVRLDLYVDQLCVLLLLLVTGVSFVVHVYSSRYMIGDARYSRFFALLALFTFAMVALVMSGNLLLIFMCWEIMGICSYLLISHQADRFSAAGAATKVFLVNAVADVGLLFGILLTYVTFDTLDIRQILGLAADMNGQTINVLGWAGLAWHVPVLTLITLLLFTGCMGKSAQVPFHVWLPFAMEAPTPVSALIHAATMVNAGPYLLIRFSALIVLAPTAMIVIAVIGGATALLGAAVSLTQTDIKKILAYSTISQIGFMIMTCGLGAFAAAVFHLLAHGFLKAFLFLSTGNQLQPSAGHTHGETTTACSRTPKQLVFGALLLACVPPLLLFTGSYESLWTRQHDGITGIAFGVIGLLSVFITAMILFSGVVSIFQPSHNENVEPRFFSALHLAGIAASALVMIGFLLSLWRWFVMFLSPEPARPIPPSMGAEPIAYSIPLLVWPLVAAWAGWAFAYGIHTRRFNLAHLVPHAWASSIYVLLLNKFYVDEIYGAYLVRPAIRSSRWLWRVIDDHGIGRLNRVIAILAVYLARWLWRVVDVRGIDRAVVGSGRKSIGLARWLWQIIDVRVIDRAVEGTGSRSISLARWMWEAVDVRRIEKSVEQIGHAADATGHKLQDVEPRTLQHHLLVLIIWLLVAIVFSYWLFL
jgi:NADH-quinone oxidoreductase subunit L